MSEQDTWPTVKRTDHMNIPGELAWPSRTLLDAASTCNDPFGVGVGIGQGANFMRFQRSNYEGLRGLFDSSGVEDHSTLRIYRLWEWVGYVVSEDGIGTEEVADTLFQTHARTESAIIVEQLLDRINMFFWDGSNRSREDDTPVMIRYYMDGQGAGSDITDVNEGFYEMKSLMRPASEEVAGGTLVVGPQGGTGSATVTTSGSTWAQLGGSYGAFDAAAIRKAAAGQSAITENQLADSTGPDRAVATTYAEELAWANLRKATRNSLGHRARRGEVGGTPLLSQYQVMRQSMMLTAGEALRDSKGKYHHGNPDRMQSEINSNIRGRLKQEGFADHWVDFFMTKENVNTITPAGYQLREDARNGGPPSFRGISGFDSGVLTTQTLAGTEPAKIMDIKATPAAESPFQPAPMPPVKIVIRAPFGYIKPPDGGGGGSSSGVGDSFDKPQLIQWFPKNYKYATWTLRTLDTSTRASEKYIFDYAPNEIQYQGLGAEWVEVPRTGDLPLVEFNKWSLMRVTMQFLIANTVVDELGNPHPDGLVTGVYDKIEKLRSMAQRPFPVSALNVDQLLRISMKRAMISGEPLEFVISDFSITSMQRTIVAGSNEITAAQCSLTLQEIPIEAAWKSKFARPKIAPPILTPDQATTEEIVNAVSELPPLTSQYGTGFEKNFGVNADSFVDVGVGPMS